MVKAIYKSAIKVAMPVLNRWQKVVRATNLQNRAANNMAKAQENRHKSINLSETINRLAKEKPLNRGGASAWALIGERDRARRRYTRQESRATRLNNRANRILWR